MMTDREKVIKGLEMHASGICNVLTENGREHCPYWENDDNCMVALLKDALELLKEQEQEISRLKHHVDCDAAEKLPSGCVGYGRGFNDDEPCETCKACEKYNGYNEEYIEIIPSVPDVPLDKLCEMLSEKYCAPYPNDPTSVECERKTCKECWKAYLTKWMEESNRDAE